MIKQLLAAGALCLSVPALGQIIPKDAAIPVEVRKAKGDFAKKLNGAVMPTGKGWKAAVDAEKWLQVMVQEGWTVSTVRDGATRLRVTPPGSEKEAKAELLVNVTIPRDTDLLEVDETFALGYAESLSENPELKQVQFKTTDSGYVVARGMKFALAGGTMMVGKSGRIQQEQLIFFAEDRIVSLQFNAREAEFSKYADDVARIFASYQTLGMRKEDPEDE